MDKSQGRRVIHEKFQNVILHNGASLVEGHTKNAVALNGQNQYVDLGSHYGRCLGNIDYCRHGMTVSLWVNPRELKDEDYLLSSPTYNIYYQDGSIISEFRGSNKTWIVSSVLFKPDAWQRLTLAWHPVKGLTLFINDELKGQDRRGILSKREDTPSSRHVYIGRNLLERSTKSNLLMDDIQVWYDDLDQLLATGQYRGESS